MIRKLFTVYKRITLMQKIGFWGSIASIVGLAIAFFPGQSESGNQVGSLATTQGNQSPAIGEK